MSRPQSEAEFLARFPSAPVSGFSRRSLLGGAIAASALSLAGCSGGGAKSTQAASGVVTYGNSQADPVPKAAIEAVAKAFKEANSGLDIKMNTVAHTTFQENINNYLQGSPDDTFAWFSGYRARFFAEKNLVGDITDAYAAAEGLPESFKQSCSTKDGKQIVIPATYYPWAVHYRKSVWKKYGYTVPKSFDEFTKLAAKMKADGLVPLAFTDKDGWEGMGMFDILNLRVNGYDYHVNLLAGKEDWTGPKVAKVFDTWKGLLPYHQTNGLGRTWQEAAQALQKGQAGMFYFGTFLAQQFAKGSEQDDLDFFIFPEIDSAIGATAIEAPTDGYMMAKRPKNEAGSKKWLSFLGGAKAQDILVQADPSVVAVNDKADTAKYTNLQKRTLEVMKEAKQIALFLDRDSRPDFAQTVMGPAIQSFIKNPGDITSILSNVEAQKKSIFTS